MADDVRDEDYYAARAVPRDPKKKKKKKKDKKERPTKPRLVLHWGREKLVETDVFISHADLYAKALTKGTAGLTPQALTVDQARPKLKENDQTFHTLSLRKEKKVGMFKKEVQLVDKVLEIELQDTATRDVAAKAKRRKVDIGPQEPRGRIARLAEEERLRALQARRPTLLQRLTGSTEKEGPSLETLKVIDPEQYERVKAEQDFHARMEQDAEDLEERLERETVNWWKKEKQLVDLRAQAVSGVKPLSQNEKYGEDMERQKSRASRTVWKSTSASGAPGIATPSSRRRVDGVEVDAKIFSTNAP